MRRLILLLTFLPYSLWASIAVEGEFSASKFCPAYVSKNKLINPDTLSTQPKTQYRLVNINRLSPNWMQVEFPSHTPAFRWVKADCGTANYEMKNSPACDLTPGLADYYVLALNWLPAFCKHYGLEAGQPECQELSGESYQANNLALHGLWPVQKRCKADYVYCGQEVKYPSCSYAQLPISEPLVEKLKQVMPGFLYGNCLDRHEWTKHGSCQELNVNNYFSLAIHLTEAVNQTPFAIYLREHIGETVDKLTLTQKIKESFGYENERTVYLGCSDGMLVDVHIALSRGMLQKGELGQQANNLIAALPRDTCAEKVTISDFSRELPF
jgi:ribonuclease T2